MKPERRVFSKLSGGIFTLLIAAGTAFSTAAALNAEEQNGGRLVLEMAFPGVDTYEIITETGHHILKSDDMGQLYIPGKPLLPQKTFVILLPPGARVRSIEVIRLGEKECEETYRIKPAPAILPLAAERLKVMKDLKAEWQENYDAAYTTDAGYPAFEGRLAGSGTLRKYSYASVSVCPFTYFPLTGRLLSYSSARITVLYDVPADDSAEAEHVEDMKHDRLADRRASRIFVNHDRMKELYEPAGELSETLVEIFDYVILTDESLVDLITSSAFFQWKKDIGNNVGLLTVTDPLITKQPGRDLAEQIRNFLRENYLTRGVEHLLIIGDYATVPMRYCFPDPDDHNFDVTNPYTYVGEVPTDYYYADLSLPDEDSWDSDGDGFYGEYGQDTPDFLADIYVGRIPTSLPNKINYTLNKLVMFEQDTGSWKDQALHPGAILFFENQDHEGLPLCDGARLQNQIELDLMESWTVSRFSEQEGLQVSNYDWPAISESSFSTDWREGQYGVVNWSGHGGPHAASRSIWEWDDGDGVPESSEIVMPSFIDVGSRLSDDYPSITTAVSCLVGYPEPIPYGNLGVELLTKHFIGAASAVFSATRPAAVTDLWPEIPGGAEALVYEFNRYMIAGPEGSEMLGNAVYDAKFYSHQHYGWDHIYEYLNLFNYNLYGDPAMLREGVSTPVVDDTDTGFVILSGSWQSINSGDAHGGSFLYSPAGTGGNSAAWRVDNIVTPGNYEVYVWKFDHTYSNLMATNAHFRVRDRDSMSGWILVNQSTTDDEWLYLGSFEFDNSRIQGVMVTDVANGYVIADAIKLVYTGSLP